MPRPSKESKILEAALDCFAQRGYEGTTIRHISEAAGVTEGAIYRHYPTKEAVAQSLYAHYLELISDCLKEVTKSGKGVKERLQQMVQSLLEQYRQNPAAATFVLLRKHNFRPVLPPDFVYPLEIVEGVIKEGQKQHLIRPGRSDLLAAIFLGCVLQPITFSRTDGFGGFDLMQGTGNDETIKEAAWAALRHQ